jgi:hypothetical protein
MEGEQAGYGVVIRNDKGVVILSAWGVISNAASEEEVELLACQEGVRLARQWANKHGILEFDCITAIKILQTPHAQRSLLAFTIKATCSEALLLPSIEARHVKREQSCVAHELAQLVRRLSHSAMWRDRLPTCVEHLIAQDCSSPVE